MAKTELTEPTAQAEQAPAKVSPKDRYNELLSSVSAKVYMMQQVPGSAAEFPEFAELATFADKISA